MIQLIDLFFDDFNASFDQTLHEKIVQRWLYCFGISEMNKTKTLSRKLIVKYSKDIIELKLPHNNLQNYMSFEQYRNVTIPLIKFFKSQICYLIEYRSLKGFDKNSFNQTNFKTEHIFNTIQYYLSERNKNSTPVIFTGMKD